MEFLSTIKNLIPDYAKDIRLNVDGTIRVRRWKATMR